ncbi:MAG: ArsA-related P-loop ATPase [Candidatus Nanopelagicales bacterium]
MAGDRLFPRVRLHIVTGKGGTGKTTVAAGLALALAAGGRRTLLLEVEGRQGISQLFDTAPLPYEERRVALAPDGGEVRALAVDPEAALLEYLEMFYNLRRAGSALSRLGAIDFATTIAPGVRDVLLTGKAIEAVRRTEAGHLAFNAVVMDAPPTGRIAKFLNVNSEVAGIARVGPIHSQANSVMAVLRSPRTAVHLVTLLEEMPVQETLDSIEELRSNGLPVGAILANMDRPAVLTTAQLDASLAGRLDRAALTEAVRRADVVTAHHTRTVDVVVDALLAEARDHAERVLIAEQERARLVSSGLPVVSLPHIATGIDLGALYELAADLRSAGFGPESRP